MNMKKGDLNLSISTMVVLILAMTLLGFGLLFMRNLFGRAQENSELVDADVQKVLRERLIQQNERLVLSIDSFRLKRGEKKVTEFALRNDLPSDGIFNFTGGKVDSFGKYSGPGGNITCYASDLDNSTAGKITFQHPKTLHLAKGDIRVLPWTIIVNSNAMSGATYFCTFIVFEANSSTNTEPYARADFSITIK